MDALENYNALIEEYREHLTDEEIEWALRNAKEKKEADKRLKEHWEKVKNPPVPEKITTEQFYDLVIKKAESKIPGFKLNEEEIKIYKFLACYFNGDERFENIRPGFSLKKGILLSGDIGSGKTTALELFAKNPYQSYSIIPCRDVAKNFADHGHQVIDRVSGMLASMYPPDTYGQKLLGICFDDLGTESIKKNFGNEINVMAEVLMSRYENERADRFKTYSTTNLDADQIEEYYGKRVRSRMREMFNMIEFPGGDKRI